MDLAKVAEMDFLPCDARAVRADLVTAYEAATGKTLYPGNPERLFIDSLAAALVKNRADVNISLQQNTLKYAYGDALDLLGTRRNCPRLAARRAAAAFVFTASGHEKDVVIPAGAVILVNDEAEFATDHEIVIAQGTTEAQGTATALQDGCYANDFLPGQLQKLVTPIAFVVSVVNSTATAGGADVESDAAYRERLALAAHQYTSTATPRAAEYMVRTYDPNIADVAVIHPRPGRREIYVLLQGGSIPGQDVLDGVAAYLLGDSRRPSTLEVVCLPPKEIPYSIAVDFWLLPAFAARETAIHHDAETAVERFIAGLRAKMGQAIIPSQLVSLLHEIVGIAKVEVATPYQAVLPGELAVCQGVTCRSRGVV